MRATLAFAVLCLAMLNPAVIADDAIPRVKIEKFLIEPREAYVRDEIRVTCTVRNMGSQPVTVRPQINLTVPGWTYYIEVAQPPQKVAPGDAFTFTGAQRPEFDYTGDYLVQCEIRDPDTGITVTGLVDEQPLRVFRLKEKTPPATRPSTPSPSVVADSDRPFYFVGETVSIHGRVANSTKPIESLSLSGAVCRPCSVSPDGTFSFEFAPSTQGLQEVVLKAEGLPTTTVSIFATAGEVEFPALFGTDRTYEAGFFLAGPGNSMPLMPVYAHRLGAKFIAFPTWSGFKSNAVIEETLTVADRLGVTIALGGDADCTGMGLSEPNVVIKKSGHQGLHQGTNMLSPEYQRRLLTTLTGLASDLRHHPSFRYILFLMETFNMRIDEGYNAENLERFSKEVLTKLRPGLTLPPTDKPQAWFDLLYGDDELWENWLLWRERTWADFMVRLRDAVKAIKPDLEIGTCETTLAQRGLFNIGMLAERGLTVHAPHNNFPLAGGDGYWAMLITRDWYRVKYGFDSLFTSFGIWDDVQVDPEQIISGMFGPIKAGGTRIPAFAEAAGAWDYTNNKPGGCSYGSIVTDLIKNASGGQKVKAFESVVSQITRLPYKDRFAVYERNGNKLPFEFALHWTEDNRELSSKSVDGIQAGTPYDAVYAVVQDWHPNGYTELLVFNDVEQRLRTHLCTEPVRNKESYTFEPGTLRKRTLTITARCDGEDIVPFVEGRPWLYYERQGDQLTIKSIPFGLQQVKLLQLVRCGQPLPYVTSSQSDLEYMTLNTSQRHLWLRLLEPAKDETAHTIKVHCATWSKPNDVIRGGRLESFDPGSSIATIVVDKDTQAIDIQWASAVPR